MDELLQLREYIDHGQYAEALILIGEMEEMSRDDKIQKIESYLQVLLLHLIKQRVEGRTTRSWDVSIRNAADAIRRINKRRRVGGHYLDEKELAEAIDESLPSAVRLASLEALEGRYDETELNARFDSAGLKRDALAIVASQTG